MTDWPEPVNQWIEVAQQALDREGADWDHSREMAEAVAIKLWNHLSDGLIPSPRLDADRLAQAIEKHSHVDAPPERIIACGRGHVDRCAPAIVTEYGAAD